MFWICGIKSVKLNFQILFDIKLIKINGNLTNKWDCDPIIWTLLVFLIILPLNCRVLLDSMLFLFLKRNLFGERMHPLE